MPETAVLAAALVDKYTLEKRAVSTGKGEKSNIPEVLDRIVRHMALSGLIKYHKKVI